MELLFEESHEKNQLDFEASLVGSMASVSLPKFFRIAVSILLVGNLWGRERTKKAADCTATIRLYFKTRKKERNALFNFYLCSCSL
jgi:hypothetical protein